MITTNLDETDKKIIAKIKEGFTYKQIAPLVYLSVPAIKYRVAALKESHDCKTVCQLILKLEC